MAESRYHVFEIVRDHGPIRLVDIAQRIGLGQTTVRGIVEGLTRQGAVNSAETEQRGTGRPPLEYSINPALGSAVGVQFEPHLVRAAVMDLQLRMATKRERVMPVAADAHRALDAAAEMVDAMIGGSATPRDRILGVAAAVMAPIDATDSTVRATARLESWVGLQPAAELERRLRLPADVGNDATLAGLAESVVGAARGDTEVMYVKLSAAIGGGIVIGGRPYQGFAGTAGELAHVVVERSGTLCFCGNRGCLWTVIGAERLLRELEQTTARSAQELRGMSSRSLDERLDALIEWAEQGDLACAAVLREAGVSAGQALVTVCNVLNPSMIVVGGTLSKAGDLFLGPVRETVGRYTRHIAPHGTARPFSVQPAQLDEWAEVLGAGAMVVRGANPRIRQRLLDLLDVRT